MSVTPRKPNSLQVEETPQAAPLLATEGALRYAWQNRFGEMLIEVVDGDVALVNGDRIEPAVVEHALERFKSAES